MINLAGKIP